MIETTRHHRMIDAFKKSHGEEVAMALADSLDFTDLATKADLEPLATKADLKHLEIATKADLKNLEIATKADIKHLATEIEKLAHTTTADIKSVTTQMAAMESRLSEKLTATINKQIWRLFLGFVLLVAAGTVQQIFS